MPQGATGFDMDSAKFLIWTVIPNHYQSAFFRALRAEEADLRVCYYEPVHRERIGMGWDDGSRLEDWERSVPKVLDSLERVPDWRTRVHVVPGSGDRFLRLLARRLSREKVAWVHLSEPSIPGWRRIAGWPVKRWYGSLINKHALGALGIGHQALVDFQRWGVRRERMALVTSYSPPAGDPSCPKDGAIKAFCAGMHPVYVYVGSLCRRKGIDTLLRAFSRLRPGSGAEPCLVLVGDDRTGGEYGRLAVSLGIERRVLFRGALQYKDLGAALVCGDVLCLPSRADGWGVVLNEAASMGLALVSTYEAGAAMHLIEPGVNGYRTRAGDVEGLRVVMQGYVDNPRLAKMHGERSRVLFESFTPRRNALRFLAAVESLMSLKGQSR